MPCVHTTSCAILRKFSSVYFVSFYFVICFFFLHWSVLQDVFLDKEGSLLKGILGASLLLHIHLIVASDILLLSIV
ncbi:hypothetical protein HDV64DRAFT_263328, partial [Trichoderma sp. TUCIM 5745]